MSVYLRLLRYLRPYIWPRFVLAVTAMLLFSATQGVMPFLIKVIFDQVFGTKSLFALQLAVVAIVAVAAARGGLNFVGTYLTDWVGQHVVCDLRDELNRHIQGLSLSFFNRRRAGQIVSRVVSDVNVVRTAVTNAVVTVFKNSTSLVVLVAVAFYMDWVLASFAFVLFPIAAYPIAVLSRRLRSTARQAQAAVGRLNALLHETVQGNRVVKAFGMEDYEAERFQVENRRLFRLYMRAARIRALPITDLLTGVAIAGVVAFGGLGVIRGTRTQGSFVGFLATLALLYEPYKRLVRSNYSIQQGLGAADRIFGLLDTRPDVVDRPGAMELRGVREGIVFHDVSFRYDEEWVLHGINLRIGVGEVVALVGVSGSGKSTLADLIPRFYDVTEGRITIDGVDIRNITLRSLRANIALVTQFTFLFNDTVRNNIAYGRPGVSMEEVVAAAKAANAHDFICSLPEGYDTVIGDLGVKLSGGERQRLAIARALLKDAPILILDEATSALDSEAELLVQEALERLMVKRTTLVVAHRLSTVRRADRIVVLAEGEIVEQGTHAELIARDSAYRHLYELQVSEDWPRDKEEAAASAGRGSKILH